MSKRRDELLRRLRSPLRLVVLSRSSWCLRSVPVETELFERFLFSRRCRGENMSSGISRAISFEVRMKCRIFFAEFEFFPCV